MKTRFMLALALVTLGSLTVSAAALADSNDVIFNTPNAKAQDTRAPSLVTTIKTFLGYVQEGFLFGEGEFDGRLRPTGSGKRVFELELKTSIIGVNDGKRAQNGEIVDGFRFELLPFTVAVQMDASQPGGVDLSKISFMFADFKMINLPQGRTIDVSIFGGEGNLKKDFDLGGSMAIRLIAIRIKQIVDVTDDGNVRLVFDGRMSAGDELSGGKNEKVEDPVEWQRIKDERWYSEFHGSAGLEVAHKVNADFIAGAELNRIGGMEGVTNGRHRYWRQYYGGALSFTLKRHVVFHAQITREHYDVHDVAPDVDANRDIDATVVQGGVKLKW